MKPGCVLLSLPRLSSVLELAAFSLLAVIVITSGSGWLVSLRTLRLRNSSLWSFQSFNNLQTIETFTLFQFVTIFLARGLSIGTTHLWTYTQTFSVINKLSLYFPSNKLVTNREIRSFALLL